MTVNNKKFKKIVHELKEEVANYETQIQEHTQSKEDKFEELVSTNVDMSSLSEGLSFDSFNAAVADLSKQLQDLYNTIEQGGSKGETYRITITKENGAYKLWQSINGEVSELSPSISFTTDDIPYNGMTLTEALDELFSGSGGGGKSIDNISYSYSDGYVDYYTILYTDGSTSTYSIENGYSPTIEPVQNLISWATNDILNVEFETGSETLDVSDYDSVTVILWWEYEPNCSIQWITDKRMGNVTLTNAGESFVIDTSDCTTLKMMCSEAATGQVVLNSGAETEYRLQITYKEGNQIVSYITENLMGQSTVAEGGATKYGTIDITDNTVTISNAPVKFGTGTDCVNAARDVYGENVICDGYGSFVSGSSDGLLKSDGVGSIAMGLADNSQINETGLTTTIRSDDYGSFAGGCAQFGYEIAATAAGSLAFGTSGYGTDDGGVNAGNLRATADGAIALGVGVIAASTGQMVIGHFNKPDEEGKYAFIIGNGTNENNRSNCFAIDWNGNIYTGDDLK